MSKHHWIKSIETIPGLDLINLKNGQMIGISSETICLYEDRDGNMEDGTMEWCKEWDSSKSMQFMVVMWGEDEVAVVNMKDNSDYFDRHDYYCSDIFKIFDLEPGQSVSVSNKRVVIRTK